MRGVSKYFCPQNISNFNKSLSNTNIPKIYQIYTFLLFIYKFLTINNQKKHVDLINFMCPIFGFKLFQDIQLIYKKTKIVNIHKFSWIIFFVKHFWNLYYTYWPNCVLLDKFTNLFIFDLANTQPTLYYVLSIK